MPFPKKNTSVPVHLDRHSPTETSSNQQQQPENHINSPLNNSSFLNNTQTTPNNPQQLGPIRTTYINQVWLFLEYIMKGYSDIYFLKISEFLENYFRIYRQKYQNFSKNVHFWVVFRA